MQQLFIDGQNNGEFHGGKSIDFSRPGLTLTDALGFYRRSLALATVPLATNIAGPFETVLENHRILAKAREELGLGGLPLCHHEGPFMSPTPGGHRGAHNPEFFRDASDFGALDDMVSASGGAIGILTVSADVPDICPLIEHALSNGVKIVALGHHNATISQIDEAVSAGASMLTHAGNGIGREVDRHGFAWYQLSCKSLSAGLITDGQHIPHWFAQLYLQTKGVESCIVVSDRSPLGGAPISDQAYSLWESDVWVENDSEVGQRIVANREKGYLGGSYHTMLHCMNQLAAWRDAWRASEDFHFHVSDVALWGLAFRNLARMLDLSEDAFDDVEMRNVELKDNRFVLLD